MKKERVRNILCTEALTLRRACYQDFWKHYHFDHSPYGWKPKEMLQSSRCYCVVPNTADTYDPLEQANYRTFNRCKHVIEQGDELYLNVFCSCQKTIEDLNSLQSYPILDEALMSELENDLKHEMLQSYGYKDFLEFIKDYFGFDELAGDTAGLYDFLDQNNPIHEHTHGEDFNFNSNLIERQLEALPIGALLSFFTLIEVDAANNEIPSLFNCAEPIQLKKDVIAALLARPELKIQIGTEDHRYPDTLDARVFIDDCVLLTYHKAQLPLFPEQYPQNM